MTPVVSAPIVKAPKLASRALVRYAWGVLGFMVLVSLWGAVVRATGSGAGCGANWPLCNGLVWPLHHPLLTTVIEFTHRSMSGVVTFLVAGLIAWTFFGTQPGHRARKAVVASGVFLVLEALLGAVLVLNHYVENNISTARVVMQSVHFTNTMLLLAALTLTAFFLRRDLVLKSQEQARISAWVAVGATLVAGATGALAALADTLFPSTSLLAGLRDDFAASSPLLVRMRWVHPAASVLALVIILKLVWNLRTRSSAWLLGLVLLQGALGGLDVLLLAPTWMQVVHLLGADIYWITLVVFTAERQWPTTAIQWV